jgi:hypothetical protein
MTTRPNDYINRAQLLLEIKKELQKLEDKL